jgi:hypothetical protein
VDDKGVLQLAADVAGWFTPLVAAGVALVIVLAALMLSLRAWQNTRGLVQALERANTSLQPVRAAADDAAAHRALKGAYQDVAAAIRQSRQGGLQRGWTELEESIVDPQAETLCNTVRPDEFFHGLAAPSRGLLWWANIALGVGLLFTFLGIIAALGQAAINMGDAAKTGAAVQDLLKVSSAKFVTSLAGVAASLILRSFEAGLRRGTDWQLHLFVDALEQGLQYLPPQRLAQQQLDSLKNIEAAQTKFASELAVAIGEKFQEQVQPMVTMLGSINGSIQNLNKELGQGLKETVGQGITDAAGAELKLLAGALSGMTERLGALPERLSERAGEAEEQIRVAAELFSQSAAGMQAGFSALIQRIEAMSEAVVVQQQAAADGIGNQLRDNNARYEAAAQQNAEALAETGAEMRRLLADVAGSVARMGPMLEEQAAAAADKQRAAGDALAAAMTKGAAEAAAAAGKEAINAVTDVVDDLVEHFSAAMARLEAFGASIARAGDNADASARRLADAGVAAERLGGQLVTSGQAVTAELGRAAGALSTAADPVRRASEAILAAVTESAQALQAQRSAAEAMIASFTATSSAAANAWRDYQERFEDVDEALAEALADLTRDMQQRADQITAFASKFDETTGRAVDRLAALVDDLAVAQTPPPAGR